MERLTEKRDGQNVIALRQDNKIKWALCSAGMNIDGISTSFLYGEYSDRLAKYENTGLTPEKVEQLQTENAELRELLKLSYSDLSRACTYSPCNSGICLMTECKGNKMPCDFKWQHQDRYDKLMKEASVK